MYYLDTSYIVKVYLHEPGSSDVLRWLEGKTGLYCSLHGKVELWSAVNRHFREGRLDASQYGSVIENAKKDEESRIWAWLNINSDVINLACDTIQKLSAPPFLRSADALHLANAAEHGFDAVYSHDRVMLESAQYFGLRGIDIIKLS